MTIKITIENKEQNIKVKPKTYFVFVLDESSSMENIKKEAISHFNEQVDVLRSFEKEQDIKVIFTKFSANVNILRFNEDSKTFKKLEENEYSPNSTTSLFDAIGFTINRMLNELKDVDNENVAVLFNIITDGYENTSKEYPLYDGGGQKLNKMITKLENKGNWTFTFMGAGKDILTQARNLGIKLGNTTSYVASSVGMRGLTAQSVGATMDYMSLRSQGVTSATNLYGGKKTVLERFEPKEKEEEGKNETELKDSTT